MLPISFLGTPKAPVKSIKAGAVYADYDIIPEDEIMQAICKYGQIHWNTSPLCNNYDLLDRIKAISKEEWVSYRLMLGITYAESHIGTNFKPQHCSTTNNWAGIKWDSDKNKDWKDGCWLHQFEDVEAFWRSFSKSIYNWYVSKDCDTAECISRRWVRWDWTLDGKQWWINRVNLFVYRQ